MSLTQEQILHIARLSKLHVNEEDIPSYQKDLGPIMEYMDILNKVPKEQLEKIHDTFDKGLIPRLDDVFSTVDREELLACSPQKIIHHQIAVDNISSRA